MDVKFSPHGGLPTQSITPEKQQYAEMLTDHLCKPSPIMNRKKLSTGTKGTSYIPAGIKVKSAIRFSILLITAS